jgi:hypothetical protein
VIGHAECERGRENDANQRLGAHAARVIFLPIGSWWENHWVDVDTGFLAPRPGEPLRGRLERRSR